MLELSLGVSSPHWSHSPTLSFPSWPTPQLEVDSGTEPIPNLMCKHRRVLRHAGHMEGNGCALASCTQGVLTQSAPERGRASRAPTLSSPKPNAPVVELLWGVPMLIPKPPLWAGPADTPDVKGDEVVLPNTELLVPLLVVWVIAPKPEVVAAKKEETWITV